MTERLVIVGGGQAAAQLIQSSRRFGFDGPITLVAGEPHVPYQRPPLSKKYLAGELACERLYLRPERFYGEHGVELALGVQAVAIDPARRLVELADGRQLPFERLVLATGARPRRLSITGADLPGVHYLRTLADVDAIRARIDASSRIVIVGAGYIGLEVAAVCRSLGHEVTILEAAPRILGRVVCEKTAAFFHDYHVRHGVRIECNAAIAEFVGDARVSSIKTRAGAQLPADCVIVGIGVEPNDDLARALGLECDNGIVVDPRTCTTDDSILAIGDCASYPHAWAESRIRLESVHNAIELGKTAAATVVGTPKAFDEVPWFWSDQYDLKLQIAGLGANDDETVVRGRPEENRFAVYYLRDGRVVAVDAVNSPKDFIDAKQLLAAKPKIPAEAIADLGIDLKDYLPQR
jgi:3-phenylpropionate/trans-cinnamate dioxygenase ferredoxin reductase component